MKILLDERVDVRFRDRLAGHQAFSVACMGWKGTKNGALIARAAADGFDALVTTDRNLPFEQNLKSLPLIIPILFPDNNSIDDLQPLAPKLLSALITAKPGSLIEIRG